MRKITRSGSQYLRYSAFNPDTTEKAAWASNHALRSDVDFVSGQKGRVPLDQSVIHCNSPASIMASRSRCYFKCFIHEGLGECGRRSNAGRQSLPNMGREIWRSA